MQFTSHIKIGWVGALTLDRSKGASVGSHTNVKSSLVRQIIALIAARLWAHTLFTDQP